MSQDGNSVGGTRQGLWDELTGLPTRALLQEHLALALARARESEQEVALLHVGLDDFKLVNDSLGHQAGDEVLRRVAERLRDRVRDTNLVARARSDEFCVMLADLDRRAEELVEIVVSQIMAAVEEPLSMDGADFQLGATVGVSIYPDDAHDEQALLKHADAAMYEAKGTGRGTFVIYAGGTQEALERLTMTARLRKALVSEAFVLHYQPIFSLCDGKVARVEALLRWRDAAGRLIPPLKFIPVAEYTGLIDPIGEWVLDAVCAQARAWRDDGLQVDATFNVSLRQFQGPDFGSGVAERLAAHDLDPGRFTVELTESTAMREAACVEPILRELDQTGVRIAIDDFGTGYSSLARLQDMPVHYLKIDQAFLREVPHSPDATRIAGATIDLVRGLGMTAIAEGVETEAQRRFLTERGCPLAQGFHLARPMPADDVGAFLRRQRRVPAGRDG